MYSGLRCSGIIVDREYMVMFVMTCAVCLHVLFMSHDLIITGRAIYWTTPVPLFFHCPILLLEHNTQPCLIHLGSTQSVSVS